MPAATFLILFLLSTLIAWVEVFSDNVEVWKSRGRLVGLYLSVRVGKQLADSTYFTGRSIAMFGVPRLKS
jgi:hypothetical protein